METTPRSEMRILAVRQPWAWAIVHGGKDVENRVRNIAGAYRGPVAIHAGAAWDWDVRFPVGETPHPTSVALSRGAIIGVVDLAVVHTAADCYQASIGKAADLWRADREAFERLPITNGAGGLIGRASLCSPWAQGDAHHLVLVNPRALAEPIPYRGALGLRRLDEDTTARILAQIGGDA